MIGKGVSRVVQLALSLALIVGVAAIAVVSPTTASAASPAFIQVKANQVTSGTTNALGFSKANTAGNLIAAYVVWDNVGGVALADSRGNTYAAATARISFGNGWSAQIFYAKNIAGGSNTVMATFGTAISSFGIVYLHEYSGLDKVNPLDVTASAAGTSAAMSSGAVTTTNASDLLFAPGASSATVNQAGTGYTTRSTAYGNRTQDRLVAATGSYAGTAKQNGSSWVMQLVAFRVARGQASPTISTTLSASSIGLGGTANDTSVLSGAGASTGTATVTYSYYTNNTCTVGQVNLAPVTVGTTGSVPNSSTVTFTSAGTYYWQAVYSGDANNNGASSPCTAANNEQLTVSVSTSVAPVAAYGFNEGTGTTTADASGNALTGTLDDATWAAGKYGSAVNLDGVDDYVDLGNPTPLQVTGSMTISGWINSAAFPADDATIVSKKTSDGTGYQLDTTIDTGPRTIGFKLTNNSGDDMVRYGATQLQLNTWYYVAGVYNAATQTMDVYLNGVLDDGTQVGAITSSQQNSTANVNIGQRSGSYNFDGRIDEVRIYSQALTAAQIQADMNTQIGSTDWTSYLQGNDHSGFGMGESWLTPTSAPLLHLAWQTADSGPYHGVFSQPVVVNGTVYWGSFDGYERATDAAGHLLWQTYVGETVDPSCSDPSQAGISSTATVRSDVPVGTATSVLYVGGGDSKMYALNADTGAILWSYAVGSNPDNFIWSSPAVFGNSVYIGVASFGDCPLVQGKLLQLNRVTGALQNTFDVVPNGCTGGGVWGSPTIDQAAGTIYFDTGNGGDCASTGNVEPLGEAIIEVNASDLSLVGSWSVPASQQLFDTDFGSTPTLFNGIIGGQSVGLVGAINKNGIYYAFERGALASGPVWSDQIATGGSDPTNGTGDVASSAFDGTTLYVGGDNTTIGKGSCDGSLNALNPSTGAFTWRDCFTDGGFVLGGVTVSSGGVVAVGEYNKLAVFSAATGGSLFSFTGTGTGPFFGPPSIANGTLYEGDMAGNLYALRSQ